LDWRITKAEVIENLLVVFTIDAGFALEAA